jgi:hypothetical protein
LLNDWAGRQLLALHCIFQGKHPTAHRMAAGHKIALKCSMPDNFLHDLLHELRNFLDVLDH